MDTQEEIIVKYADIGLVVSRLGTYAFLFGTSMPKPKIIKKEKDKTDIVVEGDVKFHTTILMSPAIAKTFFKNLQSQIEEYEKKFGEIKTEEEGEE